MLALLSARFRRWLLLVLVLPIAGRALETVGSRLRPGHDRAGRALTTAGQRMQPGRRRRD